MASTTTRAVFAPVTRCARPPLAVLRDLALVNTVRINAPLRRRLCVSAPQTTPPAVAPPAAATAATPRPAAPRAPPLVEAMKGTEPVAKRARPLPSEIDLVIFHGGCYDGLGCGNPLPPPRPRPQR
jgi:hypothetical protein